MKKIITSILLIVCLTFTTAITVDAKGQVSIPEGKYYQEGYIFIGESSMPFMGQAISAISDTSTGRVKNLQNVFMKDSLNGDVSRRGNLFFVFEGNDEISMAVQSAKEYIFSDGAGNSGAGVKKIHQIMNSNTKISHWNIISWHGEENAKMGSEMANFYVSCYRNWINYEFPLASINFLSIPSSGPELVNDAANVKAFNQVIRDSFDNCYLDYSAYFDSNFERFVDLRHYQNEVYQNMVIEIISKIRNQRIKSYRPDEVGFIIISECHCDALLWHREFYLKDDELNPIVPKDNITQLNSYNIKCPEYWGGNTTVEFSGRKHEAFSEINAEMKKRPQIRFWYIVFFVGTNDVRYQGLKGAISYMQTNIQKIETNAFYADHTVALMTTPHMYGYGHSFTKLVDNYDDAEIGFMQSIGYGKNCYDARPILDSYVEGDKLIKYEYEKSKHPASGDGIHYYGRQLWHAVVDACDTIYINSRGEAKTEGKIKTAKGAK